MLSWPDITEWHDVFYGDNADLGVACGIRFATPRLMSVKKKCESDIYRGPGWSTCAPQVDHVQAIPTEGFRLNWL